MSFPKYRFLNHRNHTFKNVVTFNNVKCGTQLIAEAGFFFTGKDDNVACYYCGGGLHQWEENDDPWILHAKWFSLCPYVLLSKGKQFVDKYSQRKNALTVANPSDDGAVPEALECITCLKNKRSLVFLPCGHCCVCNACYLLIDNCVYCRKPIQYVTAVYFP